METLKIEITDKYDVSTVLKALYIIWTDVCLHQDGDFLILKSDMELSQPSLWRVKGKTGIKKYKCTDEVSPRAILKLL